MNTHNTSRGKTVAGHALFILTLLLAIWFTLFGMVWVYFAALIIAYPVGIISLVICLTMLSADKSQKRYKAVLYLLLLGFILSIGALIILLLTN